MLMLVCDWCSWDDSSSVSSGLSDNIDTDDITSSSVSSYTNTPACQRKTLNGQVRTHTAHTQHTHNAHTHTHAELEGL